MQRIVKTLNLVNSPLALAAYRKVHEEIWPEISSGIKEVGITRMEIYVKGNLAVMIMELPDNIDLDTAMNKLANLPRQAEWEEYVSKFQQCLPGDTSAEKWHEMEKIFSLR